MNASLLTNMFTGNVAQSPAPPKPATMANTGQFPKAPVDNLPHANPPQRPTADNILDNTQSEPVNKTQQRFQHALRRKTITKESQKAHVSPESKGPAPATNAAEQPNVIQAWFANNSIPVEHSQKEDATKIKPKAGYELARLLANSKACKFSSVTGPTAKPVEKEPLLTADKSQLGLKSILSGTSKRTLTIDTQPEKGKNAGKLQISNKTPVATKALTNQESDKELMAEALTAGSKTTAVGEKPAMTDKPAASGSQKTSPLSGKELMAEAPAGDSKTTTASENTAMTDKPALSDGRETPVLNDSFQAVQDKSSDPQHKVPLGTVKSAPAAKEPADNKAEANQQGQILPELADGNGKTQTNNLSGNSILEKLSPAQVQISTNQTKNHSSTTSNNSSDSEFEQILPANNTQPPTSAEQTPASVASVKTANNASPDDVSASIGKQILESIHSSLRQGDKQITIRLHPPELGKIFIRFQEQEDQITGLLEVSKAQTRVQIEQALPQIIQNLQDSGIQIKRLEVLLTDQPEEQPYKEESLKDGWAQQHGSTNPSRPENNPDGTGINEWLTNTDSYAGFTEPQVQVSENSINILI